MKKEDNSEQFKFLSKKLHDIDIDFFTKKAESKCGFLFEVVVSYDFEKSLGNSIDLGCYPFFKKMQMSEMSRDQQTYLKSQGRNISREPSKLISTHQNHRTVVDFVDNILFLVTFMSCFIEDVKSVITFETSPFMRDYIQSLQNERAKAASPLLSRIIKNLGNWYGKQVTRGHNINTDRRERRLTSSERTDGLTSRQSLLQKLRVCI